jgi:AraC-like DNA-binding protein
MNFKRIEPEGIAAHWVESYWIVENHDATPHEQKIIPDGYPEIIFHFGDPYRININGSWEQQALSLVAGQIRQHFYLQNTGKANIFGIKLQPATLGQLFQFDMGGLTDRVLPVDQLMMPQLNDLQSTIRLANEMDERIAVANRFFSAYREPKNSVFAGVDWIFKTRGTGTIQELSDVMAMSERQVERLFQKHIGLSPKFYCRIIRFNAIFHLFSQGEPGWAELAYEAGFADQSHFIRNFKAFTGEEPSVYGFDEQSLANFFLKKT